MDSVSERQGNTSPSNRTIQVEMCCSVLSLTGGLWLLKELQFIYLGIYIRSLSCWVPGGVLGSRDIAENTTKPCLHGAYILEKGHRQAV